MITVTVPATSANVGAGFDSLGLGSFDVQYVFTFEEADRIQISSVDGTHVPTGSNNLVYRSARVVYDQLGIPLKGLRITQTQRPSRWPAAWAPARPASWPASWVPTPCWAIS